MDNNSNIYHFYYTEDLDYFLETLDFNYDNRDKIEDLDNFIRQLKTNNLYSNELDEFIRNYCKFNNN